MDRIVDKPEPNSVESIELKLDSQFNFKCHQQISCFNQCCRDLDIFLTPYDILRMKKKLGISSEKFLNNYTKTVYPKELMLPMIKLKMKRDGVCKFVSDDGCSIYSDRPHACRYYPIGFGMIKNKKNQDDDFFFLIKEEHCKGFDEEEERTVREWKENQGIVLYDDKIKDWIDIILNKRLYAPNLEPDDKSLNMFLMGSYNLDSFKKFMVSSQLLDLFELDQKYIQQVNEDENELMIFAHKWLNYVLFRTPTLTLKKDAARTIKKRKQKEQKKQKKR